MNSIPKGLHRNFLFFKYHYMLFQKLCNALNLTHVKKDPRFRNNPSRLLNYKALYRTIETKTGRYNTTQLLNIMHKAGIPASRINTVRDVVKEPQVLARNMIQKLHHKKTGKFITFGIPEKFSSCDDRLRFPAPRLGEHTVQVLKKYLGMNKKDIRHLLNEKVVAAEK